MAQITVEQVIQNRLGIGKTTAAKLAERLTMMQAEEIVKNATTPGFETDLASMVSQFIELE